jgi:hypothetical protein
MGDSREPELRNIVLRFSGEMPMGGRGMDFIKRAKEAEQIAALISFEPDKKALLEIAEHWRALAARMGELVSPDLSALPRRDAE